MNILDFFLNKSNPKNKEVETFKQKTKQEQAEEIARLCNQKGITKEDLVKLINGLKGK